MNVAIFPSWYPPQGGTFFKNQANALLRSGINVHVVYVEQISLRNYKELAHHKGVNLQIEDGIPVYRDKILLFPKAEKINMKNWVKKTVSLFELYLSKEGRPDLIHVHSSIWAGVAAYLIFKKWNIPYIITEHRGRFTYQTSFAKSQFKNWYTPFLQNAISNAKFVIPVGSQMVPKLKSYCNNPAVQFYPLANQVNVSFFTPTTEPKRKSSFRFITICNLVPEKGLDTLLKAFKIVLEKNPQVELFIGGSGKLLNPLKALSNRLVINQKVVFLGRLSPQEVKSELQQANAFVLASRVEAQGIVTVEAMAMGIPVIGTNVLSPENLPNICGSRVPAEDVSALAEEMLSMIYKINSYSPKVIRSFAIDNFSERVITDKIKRIYKEALKNDSTIFRG